MIDTSKFGSLLGTLGVASGVFYSMKKQKSLGQTTMYAIAFGIAGLIIGNSITKFYE
jgi:hypothetical protein